MTKLNFNWNGKCYLHVAILDENMGYINNIERNIICENVSNSYSNILTSKIEVFQMPTK